MSEHTNWAWAGLFLLGAYHGVNPGMGWLFAVALGMQEKCRAAVWRALAPISAGHALAIGAVVALAGLIEIVVPVKALKIAVAIILFALGFYCLRRHRHPQGGGMQVGFRDLTVWSFLMASAHGAGLMVLPLLFGITAEGKAATTSGAGHHMCEAGGAAAAPTGAWTGISVTAIHTLGYLVVTGLIAWLVYEKLGLALLRKAWLNLDLIWTVALMATGLFVLFI